MSRLLWTRKAPLGELLAKCGGGGGLVEPLCCQSTAKLLTRQTQALLVSKTVREHYAISAEYVQKTAASYVYCYYSCRVNTVGARLRTEPVPSKAFGFSLLPSILTALYWFVNRLPATSGRSFII